MNIRVIYNNSSDGLLSAAIISRHTGVINEDCYIRIDGILPKLNYDTFDNVDVIYVLDYTLPMEVFNKLKERCDNIIWIEHCDIGILHSAPINGVRYHSVDKPKATCKLLWEYLYPEKNVPLIIDVVSDYDTKNESSSLYETSKNVNCTLLYTIGHTIELYRDMLIKCIHSPELVEELASMGSVVSSFKKVEYSKLIDTTSFEWSYNGFKLLCVNSIDKSIDIFGDSFTSYDGCVVFHYKDGMYYYRVYSNPENGLNLADLCNSYDGYNTYKNIAEFVLNFNIFK